MACSAVGAVGRRGEQNALFMMFMGRAKQFQAYLSQFLPNSTDSLCVRDTQSQDLAIFVPTTTDDDNRPTKLIASPLAHVCGITNASGR